MRRSAQSSVSQQATVGCAWAGVGFLIAAGAKPPEPPPKSQSERWVDDVAKLETPEGRRATDAEIERLRESFRRMDEADEEQDKSLVDSFHNWMRDSKTFAAEMRQIMREVHVDATKDRFT